MCRHFGTLCFIFIGLVSKKNNWGEIARVFVQVEVWLKSNLDQSEEGGWGHFSLTHLSYYRPPLGAAVLHSPFLY